MLSYINEPFTLAPPVPIYIRLAKPADTPAIFRLHNEMWHQAYRGFAAYQIDGSPEQARSLWPADHKGVRIVAEQQGKIVGFGWGGPTHSALLHTDMEIYALFVSSHLRFRGIGAAILVSLAQHLAKTPGAERIGMLTPAVHVGTVAFARILGAIVARRTAAKLAIWGGSLSTSDARLALVWDDINQLAYQPSYSPKLFTTRELKQDTMQNAEMFCEA